MESASSSTSLKQRPERFLDTSSQVFCDESSGHSWTILVRICALFGGAMGFYDAEWYVSRVLIVVFLCFVAAKRNNERLWRPTSNTGSLQVIVLSIHYALSSTDMFSTGGTKIVACVRYALHSYDPVDAAHRSMAQQGMFDTNQLVEQVHVAEQTEALLLSFAQRFSTLGIAPDHVEIIRKASIDFMGEALGELWTEAMKEAWLAAINMWVDKLKAYLIRVKSGAAPTQPVLSS